MVNLKWLSRVEIGGARADSHLLECSLLPHAPTTTFFRSIVLNKHNFFFAVCALKLSNDEMRNAIFYFEHFEVKKSHRFMCTHNQIEIKRKRRKNPITISKCSKNRGWHTLDKKRSRQADEWVPSLKSERMKWKKKSNWDDLNWFCVCK